MKFSLVPRYPRTGASSRLRVYTLHEALLRLGHDSAIGYDPAADILMVQKSTDASWAEQAKRFNGLVVYDFDDREVYEALPMWNDVADILLTDTQGHATECGFKATVLSDPIDFCTLEDPLPLSGGRGIVWFGHYTNYHSIAETIENAVRLGVKTRIISSPDVVQYLPVGAEFVPFDLGSFTTELRRSETAVLSHKGGDPYKSNNKMTCAITHGLPCIAIGSDEYEELNRVASIRSFEELQDYVWERYHPDVIAKRFVEIVSQ